jgi:hypothetical protein
MLYTNPEAIEELGFDKVTITLIWSTDTKMSFKIKFPNPAYISTMGLEYDKIGFIMTNPTGALQCQDGRYPKLVENQQFELARQGRLLSD